MELMDNRDMTNRRWDFMLCVCSPRPFTLVHAAGGGTPLAFVRKGCIRLIHSASTRGAEGGDAAVTYSITERTYLPTYVIHKI